MKILSPLEGRGIRYHYRVVPDMSSALRRLKLLLWCIIALTVSSCDDTEDNEVEGFFERQNAAHEGDYIATYPLSDPDSCIARLKQEVPKALQPWACLSLWYHLPRDSPEVNFRLLELYEENYPHDTVFAFCQMMRAEFYVDLAEFDLAKICTEDAYRRYMELGRPLDASDARYLQARSYIYQSRFAEALEIYFELLDVLNKASSHFSDRHANLYSDITVAYERSGDRPQSLEWAQKSWKADVSKIYNPWRFRARTARHLSVHYLRTQPDSSIYWVKQMQKIFKEANPEKELPAIMDYRLARAYSEAGQYQLALPLFQGAYHQNPFGSIRISYFQVPLALGECYLNLGQLDSAEWYIKESLASPDTGNLYAAHRMLSDIYAKRGDWESALNEANESHRLYRIKLDSDKAKEVVRLEAQYENTQKEHRIESLEQEQLALRLRQFIWALALLSVILLLSALYIRQHNHRLILVQQNRLLSQEKELINAREKLKSKALMHSRNQLEDAKKELNETGQALALKSRLIRELQIKLSQQAGPSSPSEAGHASQESSELKSMKILTDQDWLVFKERYEECFPGFLDKLKEMFPKLTSGETRLILLMKLKFDNREAAESLGISLQSVWRSRHRLSRKLGLNTTGDLDVFIERL
ncbi:tetratricopeptide repeat protein [Phaeodactylibacter xiamenensis]|uniref:tetratricopeptide repeat protein n=1 Tax=Phaeodactylibacter xiamenensis TaxID=1524460 RepID=UPI003CCB98FF